MSCLQVPVVHVQMHNVVSSFYQKKRRRNRKENSWGEAEMEPSSRWSPICEGEKGLRRVEGISGRALSTVTGRDYVS